jgi:predicted phosphodiesterase
MAVKFGIFADLHVDIMHDAQQRLEAFLDACRRADVDFIIHLGDFCYPESRQVLCKPENRPVNIENALHTPTYAHKDAIISLFRDFEKPGYHVIGNHDCDMCTKEEVLAYYGVSYKPYYSFDRGGFHFVVLDPNYCCLNGKCVSYQNGNYFDAEGDLPYLPPEQLTWLREDLSGTPYPSVLFSHQRLMAGRNGIRNADALGQILADAPNRVVLALNGHEHMDNLQKVDGTWFLNINSISNYWLGEEFTCLGRYGAEVDEKYPNIRYVVPYRDPVYSIITLEETGARVQGIRGEFVGITPEQQGVHRVGTPFCRKLCSPITPSQQDRWLPF